MTDIRVVDNAAVRNNRVIDMRAIDLRAGQPARSGKNRRAHIKKVEARQLGSHVEIGIEERADRPHVLPVTLEDVGIHVETGDGRWDYVPSEVSESILQQAHQDLAVKNVNAH